MYLGNSIKKAREDKGLTQSELSEKTNVSVRALRSYESNERDVTIGKLQKIADVLEVSIVSLLNLDNSAQVEEEKVEYKISPSSKLAKYTSKPIPLVNVKAVGGFGNASFAIEEHDIEDYYVIPKFKYRKVDFMIEVVGDSMRPRYKGGDIVACQVIKNRNYIQWNRVHVIATEEQGVIIKRIAQGAKEGYIKVIADNPDYPPFEIPESEIKGIALVAGGVVQD